MSEIDTGGPAFPSHGSMGEVVQEGATLRDYFAGKAMQSAIRNIADWKEMPGYISKLAYAQADAMLKARKQ